MREHIKQVCNEMAEFLAKKNESYGSSVEKSVSIFFKGDPIQAINVRIDDKLNRLKCGAVTDIEEDTEKDLIGYLILKRALALKLKDQQGKEE